MNLNFLPALIRQALDNCNFSLVYEIRLREGFPIKINYGEQNTYLSSHGATIIKDNAIICQKSHIIEIIENVTEKSTYAFNDRIKQGFITSGDGVRIGLAGEIVSNNNEILTIKNITSLNVRIPHEILDSSKDIFNKIYKNNSILNTIILSPPGLGKTTILKDLATKLNKFCNKSILIIDERGEFNKISGENIDVIKYSDKLYAFNFGIRTLAPQIIITDEIVEKNDWLCVESAVNSGVKILASCHTDCIENFMKKEHYKKHVFDRLIVLDCEKKGKLNNVYDGEGNLL